MLDEVIKKLEAAPGPDRTLDEEIWRSHGGSPYSYTPTYTASIDAAIRLVPSGWDWQVYSNAEDSPGNGFFIGPFALCEDLKHDARRGAGGGGATPALALCVAALKSKRVASGE